MIRRVVVQVSAQVAETAILTAGGIELDGVVGQVAAATIAEHPAPAGGVHVIGQRETEGSGHLLHRLPDPGQWKAKRPLQPGGVEKVLFATRGAGPKISEMMTVCIVARSDLTGRHR